ncbi:MAG: glycosyltransferase family 4 protein [Roseiflexaceae bacterium]|nr:glycosyltransferase family 4 protein [Roseiflexaceae bacterium]
MTTLTLARILLPTDVFPPKCGGAGWSAHALALALIEQGHRVMALVPQRGKAGLTHADTLGVPTYRRGYTAPNIPFILNYFRHERLWPVLANDLLMLARERTTTSAGVRSQESGVRITGASASNRVELNQKPLIIHAQHVQVAPAAVLAAKRLRVPVVITVRDHWPWDYFATGLHANMLPYPRQTWASLATDLPARLGPLRGAAALIAIPYMRAHLQRRQAFLRQADAVIVGSTYMARRLAEVIDPARIQVIPNMVDLEVIEQTIAQPSTIQHLEQPFVLFVGKLERNKGAHLIPEIIRAMNVSAGFPVVIAGDGPLKPEIQSELQALGVQARFLEWIDHDEVLRLMARCTLLLYPSAWGEPLTRVLLEACACGAPMVAMPTGGTADIITNGVNGMLAPGAAALGRRAAELLANPDLRQQLSAGAKRVARERFAVQAVIGRVEALYSNLLTPGVSR